MVKVRIEGLPEEVEKFAEKLKKDGYVFLQESSNYPNRNSDNVRRYVDIKVEKYIGESKNKITGMGGAFSVNIAKYCSNDKYAIDIKGEKNI
ncbi:DUF3970 family protein [Ruminococcus sp.]|jgi:hypothetical protein|uniref:DUF3970 family protein n=1 Tax=Ruminococcus sp. TaxID=41978 RepID=UPI0025D4BF68|nr:DUF3970 family protein [Ruminococcus sp.]